MWPEVYAGSEPGARTTFALGVLVLFGVALVLDAIMVVQRFGLVMASRVSWAPLESAHSGQSVDLVGLFELILSSWGKMLSNPWMVLAIMTLSLVVTLVIELQDARQA